MATLTIKPTSANDFYENFTGTPDHIQGQPSYNDIRILRDAIYANAAAVPSTLGGGNHGHLGMVMEDNVFATLSATAWQTPVLPVLPPLPAQATAAQIAEINRRHTNDVKTFHEVQNLDRALVRLLSTSIDEIFLKPLHQPYVKLLNRTTKTILNWLITNYGRLLPQELAENRLQITKTWTISEPFQVLIDRFQEAAQVAADGELPISDGDLINAGLVALTNTGVLERYIEKWNDLAAPDRATWIQFTTFFQPHIMQYQSSHKNAAPHYAQSAMTESLQQIITEQKDNKENTDNALAYMASSNAALLDNIDRLQTALATLTHKVNNVPQQHTAPRQPKTYRQQIDNGSYCWTHGCLVHKDHNSRTCKSKATGHKIEATRQNPMGGNRTGLPAQK